MLRIVQLAAVFLLTLVVQPAAFADMVSFDFDDIQSSSRKGPKAIDVENYMEALFGSNISVSGNTATGRAGAAAGSLQNPDAALGISGGFLKAGKGRGAGISFDFGESPIESFSVDWLLRKGGRKFTILADGVIVNQQTLTKNQRKAGLSGHQDSFFFDDPVHRLEFIGVKKQSFAIDNLFINIPLPGSGETEDPDNSNEENEDTTNSGEPTGNGNPYENNLPPTGDPDGSASAAAVPELSSILMLVFGLAGGWWSRRVTTA